MSCDVSGEQLWSWIDREAPELAEHLAECLSCRARAARLRREIGLLAGDAAEALPLPDKIGPYTIRRLIGEGGQALVYEAEQPFPRRPVALKLLKGGALADKSTLRRFRREIQSLARLNHPGIATIYEAGRTPDGLHYFAMELVNGVPLHSFVKEKNPPRRERLRLFHKVCEAVHYAHENGVIHRDLKPSNIMITPEGEPKILDFGLSRLTWGDPAVGMSVTQEGHVEGTPRYMSPEQVLGAQSQIDHRTDVYALGIILYELMTGTPPRTITTVSPATVKTICEETPRIPSSIDSTLRGDLDALVMKALEAKREDRYQSVRAFADDIARHLEGAPIRAKRPGALHLLRRKITVRVPQALGLVVLAATVAGLAYVSWKGTRPPSDDLATRMKLLEVRCELFRDSPTAVAFHQADDALSRYPGVPEAVLVSAQADQLLHRYSQAAAKLVRALERDPSQWVYGYLKEEIESARRTDDGEPRRNSYWNEELALSADAWYLRSFATLNTDSALAWAKEAVAREPGHRPSLAAIAYLSEIDGDLEGTLAATEYLTHGGYAANSWIRYRATLLARLERFEEALDECDRLIARWPDDYYVYTLRARIARRSGRYADADRDFSTAIEKRQGTQYEMGWLYYHRGTLRWLLGREEDAANDYMKAHEYLGYPTFVSARLYILLRELDRMAEAEDILADARRANFVDPWLGRIFECMGGSLTPEDLAAIAESDGESVRLCEGYYYAAEATRLAGKIGEAREWFKRCVATGVECDPHNVLESQSEYELAGMRLAQMAGARSTNAAGTPPHR